MQKYLEQFLKEDFTSLAGHFSTEIQYVDFFSGCGGMSYGFHQAQIKTGMVRYVGAFDFDEHANKTYQKNLGYTPSQMDIGSVELHEIKENLINNSYNPKLPLIVIGCAPCQGFSSHRKKDKRKDDRNSLVGKFAEIAVGLNADFIIMENVPDLLAMKHKHHFDAFKSILDAAGYNLTVKIVNMAEHGVPQARFRTLVLASKEFHPSLPPTHFSTDNFMTVRDAISRLPALDAGQVCLKDTMHITSKHRPKTVDILKMIPKNGGSRPSGVGPSCLDRVAGFYDVYGRLYWDKPSITITARCRTPSCGRFTHPEQDRGLTVREAALLQGFPPDFIFEGPFDDKFKQVGNAVPPLFSIRLAEHVLGLMLGVKHPLDNELPKDQKPFKSYSSIIAHVKSKAEEENFSSL